VEGVDLAAMDFVWDRPFRDRYHNYCVNVGNPQVIMSWSM